MRKMMSKTWERKFTYEFRERKILSVFPFIILNGISFDFHWTGKWFKYVKIRERKVKDRHLGFEDGWRYKNHWSKWETSWILVNIFDNEETD